MTKDEQRLFIETYMKTLRDVILDKIENMPEDWDGFELRQYTSDIAESQLFKMGTRRKRRYKNTLTVRNL